MANSASISRFVRLEVGSSMIRTFVSTDRAFTTSTICCWAMLKSFTMVSGDNSTPRRASSALLSSRIFFSSICRV